MAETGCPLAGEMSGHIFFADLDGLKAINDRFGHREGDEAIRQAAAVVSASETSSPTQSRYPNGPAWGWSDSHSGSAGRRR
mgnify:CR=1 FL=1